jgi:hypothetical protein
MVENMLSAIAVLSLAFGTVPEVHLGMGLVGDSAHRTAVKGFIIPDHRTGCPFHHLSLAGPDG